MRLPASVYGLTYIVSSLPTIARAAPSSNLPDRNVENATMHGDYGPHRYTFQELSPSHYKMRQPYFRFLILFRMKEPKAKSHEHWSTVHADLTMIAENTGVDILRYVQYHADEENQREIEPLLIGDNIALAPYDGIAEFHAKNSSSLLRFINRAFADPAQSGDQENFVDKYAQLHLMAGYDNLIFGSAIETSGGVHGILHDDGRLHNA